MKKINFLVILMIIIISINVHIYIDFTMILIPKTISYTFDKITNFDIVITTILIVIWNIFPTIFLAYIYRKIYENKLWIILIFIIYSFFWVYTSYLVVHGYIQHFGHTWLDIEVFYFMLEQEHFYMAYILSLVPMVFLIFYNNRSSL